MKKIENYHDLVVEKHRLQQKISLLKRDLNNEITEIKENFKPITNLISMFGSSNGSSNSETSSVKPSLLKMGANLGFDLLVGPRLAKVGWAARTFGPPLIKSAISGITSRFFNRKKKLS